MLELYRRGRWADSSCADRLQPIFWYSLVALVTFSVVMFCLTYWLAKRHPYNPPPSELPESPIDRRDKALVYKVIGAMISFLFVSAAVVATLSPNLTETWLGNTAARETGCHRLTAYSHSFDFITARQDFRYHPRDKSQPASYTIAIRQNGNKMELHFKVDDKDDIQRLYKLTPYLMQSLLNWINLKGYPVSPEMSEILSQDKTAHPTIPR